MKIKLIVIYFLISSQVSAQISDFKYKQSIEKPTEKWHQIQLPSEIFQHLKTDLSDIRIYGISESADTIEVPFLINTLTGKIDNQIISFKRLNFSNNQNGYYYTFKVPTNAIINEINLDFNQSNFDWQIQLEGSQNQNNWFTILNNYRIVSIQNQWTNYQFTKLVFPNSKYRYFRLLIKSKTNPRLTNTMINQKVVQAGNYQNYTIKKQTIQEDKKQKRTEILLDLALPLPLNSLDLEFDNSVDYYRNIQIQYLSDSFKTENGWRYNYQNLTSGTVTSIEENKFDFQSTVAQKFKIIINNYDNTPLTLKNITTEGLIYNLVGRFDEQADFAVYYGNSNLYKPNYDISRFTNKIPSQLTNLALGKIEKLKKETVKTDQSLFQNKLWLWGIMLLIIVILGGFSLKMISGSSKS